MTTLIDGWVIPGLALLAGWSVRWGVGLAALAAWFAVRPPRRAATRHRVCAAALAAGLLLPVAPRWGDAALPWPPPARGTPPAAVPAPPPVARVQSARDPDGMLVAVTPAPVGRSAPAWPVAVERPGAARSSSPLGPWRLAALAVAGAWAGLTATMLARLAGARSLLARVRRGARPLDDGAQRLLGDCRRALGLARPAALAIHPGVGSPVALGGLRPLVLVPPDWPDWAESRRRACLLHELAHLARYDDWAKLAQELVRAPFAFHPLVRWLTARLDRERELLCDEAVVAQGSDPVAYARLLLELARRPGRRLPFARVSRAGCIPFLDRRTVAVRIERLLEDDMPRTLSRPSPARSVSVGALALAAAFGIGGLRVRAVSAPPTADDAKPTGSVTAPEPRDQTRPTPPATKASGPGSVKETPRELRGVVLGPDGRPVAGATIVVGCYDTGLSDHQVITADAGGRFAWALPGGAESTCLIASKPGLAAAVLSAPARAWADPLDLKLRLATPEPFAAVLVDDAGAPLAGARIRVAMMAHASESKNGTGSMVSTGYARVPWEVVGGSPVEGLFATSTGADGSFTLAAVRPGSGLMLDVSDADGRRLRVKSRERVAGLTRRTMEDQGFVTAAAGETARLVAVPAARVAGRVVTMLPGVPVDGLVATYQDSHQPGVYRASSNFGARVKTDVDGRFVFDGLGEGTVNVFVHGEGENTDWTYRAAKDVTLAPGATAEVTIELIRGIDVEGTVVERGSGRPIEGAQVGVYGPFRPRTGAMTTGARTDARGRFHYRLPSGETYFYVMGPPAGYARLPDDESSRTVTIPEGADRYEVPPIELAPAVTVRGTVVDAAGAPVAGARVVGVCEGSRCVPFAGAEAVTDARGAFRLPAGWNNTIPAGQVARLLIRLRDGAEHEAAARPAADGAVAVRLNAVVAAPAPAESPRGAVAVEGPREVSADELAGVVVDRNGRPIEGVEAHAWHWVPGHVTRTDAEGVFRLRFPDLPGLPKDERIEVRFRKEGYETQFHLDRVRGQAGWVVVLGDDTYFEGRVLAPDGAPAAGASIRADSGPRRARGFVLSECYTETISGNDGRYRLHVEPGSYDIQVRVPGVGVARLKEVIDARQVVKRDIALEPGVTFVARFVDHATGRPVEGVKLSHWQKPGIEGTSGPDGRVEIRDVPPGKYPRFQVEADGYARWWSDAALSPWSRFQKDAGRGFQRNFDGLDFEVTPGMAPVAVELERAATVRGRVTDPDGEPVAGATVAPALTGTGNSLTGDTRFSVETDRDGRFTMRLPASGDRDYNLVAHDGKHNRWRAWANGVLPPFRTKPGEEVDGVELRLTRPATVRGRVTDAAGQPVAGREVRASAADRLENRYYDPTTRTDADGRYELKFIRPGEQYIQVAPFWLDARQAPEGTSRTVTLEEGQVEGGVDFRVSGAGEGR
jgi:protocatechuate 3,4-dioxygenase beta subunit